MAVATTTDVEDRIGRPLTPHEDSRVAAYLEDAEVEIRRLAPADRLTDPDWEPAVISVECAVAIRAARLPEALTSVVPAEEGAGFASTPLTQGAVYLRRSERRTLGLPLVGVGDISPPEITYSGHEDGWPDPWPYWWGW